MTGYELMSSCGKAHYSPHPVMVSPPAPAPSIAIRHERRRYRISDQAVQEDQLLAAVEQLIERSNASVVPVA